MGRRDDARRAVLADITEEGRRQLARDGAAALSVRSIARALDMASSAIYRYVASRDELLTMLIVAGYDRLADELEATGDGRDGRELWFARGRAVRAWAAANPHEWALLYGSPVPGYAAPEDTIRPATRVYAALAAPLATASPVPAPDGPITADAVAVLATLGLEAGPGNGVALLEALAGLIGLVSLERFGHLTNVVGDPAALFDQLLGSLADRLGLAAG